MVTLDLFPTRVAFVDDAGRLTPAAYRALQTLFQRVGGVTENTDLQDSFAVFAPVAAEGNAMPAESILQQVAVPDGYHAPMDMQPSVGSDYLAEMVFQGESSGGNVQPVTVGASPFAFVAPQAGMLSISGGAVTPFTTLTRGVATVTLGLIDGLVPVNFGDVVTVTYTVLPTLYFIPR